MSRWTRRDFDEGSDSGAPARTTRLVQATAVVHPRRGVAAPGARQGETFVARAHESGLLARRPCGCDGIQPRGADRHRRFGGGVGVADWDDCRRLEGRH